MTHFRVIPIAPSLSDQVRTSLKSPQYGHPAHVELASGTGPCRSCLRQFRPGEEQRILFTYNPFEGLETYPSPGPVFIHQEICVPFADAAEFPPELRTLPLTLEGYGKDRWIIARERPSESELEAAITRLFISPAVQYIHIRHSEAGCYIARIERGNVQG
jgi:hypothetical protein